MLVLVTPDRGPPRQLPPPDRGMGPQCLDGPKMPHTFKITSPSSCRLLVDSELYTCTGHRVISRCSHRCQMIGLCAGAQGEGAGPGGNRPFLDVLDVHSGASQRIWQSQPPHYERPGAHVIPWNMCHASQSGLGGGEYSSGRAGGLDG